MNQSRGIIPIIAGCAIVAAAFTAVSLLMPFVRTDTFWAAFASAWVAMVVALAANLYVIMTARPLKSALYRVSITAITFWYLGLAAVVSIVFMANSLLPIWMLAVIQIVLLALCLIGVLGGETGARLVEADEARTKAQTAFIQNMRMQADMAASLAADDQTRRAVEDLAAKIRYADPVSSPATAYVDQQIANNMAAISNALQTGAGPQAQALCAQTLTALDQRAAICRSTK